MIEIELDMKMSRVDLVVESHLDDQTRMLVSDV